MQITLTPDIEAIIQQEVDSGRFADASEVIAEAVQLFQRHAELERLRKSIREAEAEYERGEYFENSPQFWADIEAEAQAMTARGEKPDSDVVP